MDYKNLIIECLGLQDVVLESFTKDRENLKLTLTVRQNKDKCRDYFITAASNMFNMHGSGAFGSCSICTSKF